jgi:hypothetical protein
MFPLSACAYEFAIRQRAICRACVGREPDVGDRVVCDSVDEQENGDACNGENEGETARQEFENAASSLDSRVADHLVPCGPQSASPTRLPSPGQDQRSTWRSPHGE